MSITFGSVCSGIEAATVAFDPVGWAAAWFAEIEPFPSALLAHHYPRTQNLGDMTKIAAGVLAGLVAAPDVLCGGTPCQAFSVAGLRESLGDARGGLTLKFVELADAIDHVRAGRGESECVIFWENVHGVLSTKDNAFGCFLGALVGESIALQPTGGRWTDAGCVYGPKRAAAWRVLDAQYFQLAQRRRRVFVVASARPGFDPATVLFERDGVRRDHPPSREAGQVAPTIPARSLGGGGLGTDFDCDGGLIPNLSKCLTTGTGLRLDADTDTILPVAHTLRDEGFDASEDGTGRGTPLVPVAFDTTQITSAANYSNPRPGDPCHPLAAGAHPPAIAFDCKASGQNGFGVGEIASTLRAMGSKTSHSNGGGQLAVAIQAGALRINPSSGPDGVGVSASGVAYTLEARAEVQAVQSAMAVRRLTPVECERLMGFPDNYTQIPNWNGWRKMDASETPEQCIADGLQVKQNKKTRRWRVKDVDGPRYKALGNSWAVPVVRWIGRRIDAQLRAAA